MEKPTHKIAFQKVLQTNEKSVVAHIPGGQKSVKTLKNYKTIKSKQNEKRFADLASISHGILFKIRKKNNSKNSRLMALIQTT